MYCFMIEFPIQIFCFCCKIFCEVMFNPVTIFFFFCFFLLCLTLITGANQIVKTNLYIKKRIVYQCS